MILSIENRHMHPGNYIRKTILEPRKLTVTKAAELIGMSRPNLSNFLNGKVTATPEMAARLERTFGVDAKMILHMQTEYNRQTTDTSSAKEEAQSYVPPFLGIKANDITSWFSSDIASRTQLAVLLRILIHSTGHDIHKIDFPGNDDAERPGWDGVLDIHEGTPWIPAGLSGWEFGVTENIKAKADGDYKKSIKATSSNQRKSMTYVFITPRRWRDKVAWVESKIKEAQWKDVRAYDASDLEQWMEQSIAAQTWFANSTHKPSKGVRSLDRCWSDWANETQPPLPRTLFLKANDNWKETIQNFLTSNNPTPLTITADSKDEALAFLSACLDTKEFEQYKNRVLVFDEEDVLPVLAQGTSNFIAVIHTREVEREFSPYSKSIKSILIYPRGFIQDNAQINLEPVSYEVLSEALKTLGKTRDEINRLVNACGGSLTVLRRLLSSLPAIKKPIWSDSFEVASSMIPFVLAGVWTNSSNDLEILAKLTKQNDLEELEASFKQLLLLDDPPVWEIDNSQGVISKVDALFAIAKTIKKSDIERFLTLVPEILCREEQLKLQPENKQWFLGTSAEQQSCSENLRKSIAETLVLLSVHGKELFGKTLYSDIKRKIATIVRRILTPVTTYKLETHPSELPLLAEASPNDFLDIIESDLKTENPETLELLRPVPTSLFSKCPRTGILWALEVLAWNPDTFPRVIGILGKMAETTIDDNWGNKPIHTLEAIFCPWMPQTQANPKLRLWAIESLFKQHPKVAWDLCVHQFRTPGNTIGHSTNKPKWRSDGYMYGEPVTTWEPYLEFTSESAKIMLNKHFYTIGMLCDLISCLPSFETDIQNKVWTIVEDWLNSSPSDDDKAVLREIIRRQVLTHKVPQEENSIKRAVLTDKGKELYSRLQPKDVMWKHAWLFQKTWVDESADELVSKGDFRIHDQHIEELRIQALCEIFKLKGITGIIEFSLKGDALFQIGILLSSEILCDLQLTDLIIESLNRINKAPNLSKLIAGVMNARDEKKRVSFLEHFIKTQALTKEDTLRLLLLSPYRATTWLLVERLPMNYQKQYWREVTPQYIDSVTETTQGINQLLNANRARAAFASAQIHINKIDISLLVRLLIAVTRDSEDKNGEYLLESYSLKKAFRRIQGSSVLSLEDKASLEFTFIEVLTDLIPEGNSQQILNLEKYLEIHPEFFAQLIIQIYTSARVDKKTERTKDISKPIEQCIVRLLNSVSHIPGQENATQEERARTLFQWAETVRHSCAEHDLQTVGDQYLGLLLSHSPSGEDGIWPNEAVRNVIEKIHSQDILWGVYMGLYNSRGPVWRQEGGKQERELADKYRQWLRALEDSHPFVASLLKLMVKTYEDEAEQYDKETRKQRRLEPR